jgi:hypothetical protein
MPAQMHAEFAMQEATVQEMTRCTNVQLDPTLLAGGGAVLRAQVEHTQNMQVVLVIG